jgi:hypothetical protein
MNKMNTFSWFIYFIVFSAIALTIKYFYIVLPLVFIIRLLIQTNGDKSGKDKK